MMQLIIFDLDGTLLNTLDDLAAAANAALCTCGFPTRSLEEVRQFVGNGVAKLLERALPEKEKTAENLARIKNAFFSYYDQHLWDYTHPYEGIQEVLTALQRHHIKLAVASNKYQAAAERLITYFFPDISFVAVLGQRENIPTKPNPQIVFDIFRITGINPKDVLYVGDSAVDMQTAQNAGVQACGVTWGFRSRNELASCQPNYLINEPSQLLEMLNQRIRN